jgi:hypothetical protein
MMLSRTLVGSVAALRRTLAMEILVEAFTECPKRNESFYLIALVTKKQILTNLCLIKIHIHT